MKKVILFALALSTGMLFAQTFEGSEQLVDEFMNKGLFVKIYQDKNNTRYMSKTFINSIRIDEDDMEIHTSGYNAFTGKDNDSSSSNVKKYSFSLDENSNIIIRRK